MNILWFHAENTLEFCKSHRISCRAFWKILQIFKLNHCPICMIKNNNIGDIHEPEYITSTFAGKKRDCRSVWQPHLARPPQSDILLWANITSKKYKAHDKTYKRAASEGFVWSTRVDTWCVSIRNISLTLKWHFVVYVTVVIKVGFSLWGTHL